MYAFMYLLKEFNRSATSDTLKALDEAVSDQSPIAFSFNCQLYCQE